MSNKVVHEKHGAGQIIPATEVTGADGLVESVDVIFESGIVNVNAEDLQEISKDLLTRYRSKAINQQTQIASKRGRKSKADFALSNKRSMGRQLADTKIAAHDKKDYEERAQKHSEILKHVHEHVPLTLSAHGYKKVTEHPTRGDVYMKVHHGAVSTVTHHHPNSVEGKRNPEKILTHHNSTGWQSGNDRLHHSQWDYKEHPNAKEYGGGNISENEKKSHGVARVHKFLADKDKEVEGYVKKDF